jgi:hypothetical protein
MYKWEGYIYIHRRHTDCNSQHTAPPWPESLSLCWPSLVILMCYADLFASHCHIHCHSLDSVQTWNTKVCVSCIWDISVQRRPHYSYSQWRQSLNSHSTLPAEPFSVCPTLNLECHSDLFLPLCHLYSHHLHSVRTCVKCTRHTHV